MDLMIFIPGIFNSFWSLCALMAKSHAPFNKKFKRD
jgi:hypothetical protein